MINKMLDTKSLLDLDNTIKSLVQKVEIAGLNVSVLTPLQIWTTSHGIKQVFPSVQPNYIDALYDLGNLTCFITTFMILKDIKEKRIHITDKISKYVKDFNQDTTIEMCLNHTSNISNPIYHTKEGIIEYLFNNKGNNDSYISDYLLLGFVLQSVHSSFSKAYDELYKLLNLKHMTFSINDFNRINCAHSLFQVEQGKPYDLYANIFDGICGYSGLFASIQDFNILVKTILNNGINHKINIINGTDLTYIFKCMELKNGLYQMVSKNGCAIIIHPKYKFGMIIFGYFEDENKINETIDILIDKSIKCIK